MIGVLQMSPSEAMQLSYRRLYIAYIGYMLDSWDRTSLLAGVSQNLLSVVCGIMGVYVQPLTPHHFHPYRDDDGRATQSNPNKMRIDKSNFGALKTIGKHMGKR